MVVSSKWGVLFALLVLGPVVSSTVGGFESEGKINLGPADSGVSLARQTRDDTVRADPLEKLRKYRGGYNIANKHYWSSVVFTGLHGYAVGLLWLFCGVLLGGFRVASSCNKSRNENDKAKKKHMHRFKKCNIVLLILATAFTALAIIAAGVALGVNAQFYLRARQVVNIIKETADNAYGTLHETTEALKSISKAMETSTILIADPYLLESTSEELDSVAANILIQTKKKRRQVNNGLKILFITSTVIIALSLITVVGLSVSGFLCFKKLLRSFIAVCWTLTFLCWILFGLYFFLDNFAGDTCAALKNFQQDPYNNTLSSFLPCKGMLPAKSALSDVSGQIHNLVEEVNAVLLPQQSVSLPFSIQVCDPFSGPPDYFYQPENCPDSTVRIGDIPKVLKKLTCSSTNNGSNCISESNLQIVQDYATSVQGLLNAFPGIRSLVECQTVTDAFTEITSKHCKPMMRSVRILWTTILFLSIVTVLLVLTWVVKLYHDRDHHFFDGTVRPQYPAAGNTLHFEEGQNR